MTNQMMKSNDSIGYQLRAKPVVNSQSQNGVDGVIGISQLVIDMIS